MCIYTKKVNKNIDISADKEIAAIFERKYIDNHEIIVKGWNVSIYNAQFS